MTRRDRRARHAALLAAAALLSTPLLPAAPASAVGPNVICVPLLVSGCDDFAPTVQAAVAIAQGNALDDEIRVAAGLFVTTPLDLDGTVHDISLVGAGQGATTLTMASSPVHEDYLTADTAVVSDLTVLMAPGADSFGDNGIVLTTSELRRVTVQAVGTDNIKALQTNASIVADSSFLAPLTSPNGNVTIQTLGGGNVLTDLVVTGQQAVQTNQTGPVVDSLSRLRITASYEGVVNDWGALDVDDTLIDLGTTGGWGLVTENSNNSTMPMTIDARHLTIVGGGPGSQGVRAVAASAVAQQVARIDVADSVIRGPQKSLVEFGGHTGNPAQKSSASIHLSYSDWGQGATLVSNDAGSVDPLTTGIFTTGVNKDNVDPHFVDAAGGDFRLATSSPLLDQGDPAPGGPTTDLDRLPRVADSNGDGTPVRDLGAYEYQDVVAPDTSITSGPAGLTNDATPTFGLGSEPGATFECRIDAAAYAACSSPFTTASLSQGAHTLSARAKDAAGNTDASPATRSFTVDTVAPAVTLTKKPARRVTTRKVRIVFTSETGATFACSVDGKGYKPCTSPLKLKVKLGKHVVLIRATDAAGNVGAPVRARFKRVPRTR